MLGETSLLLSGAPPEHAGTPENEMLKKAEELSVNATLFRENFSEDAEQPPPDDQELSTSTADEVAERTIDNDLPPTASIGKKIKQGSAVKDSLASSKNKDANATAAATHPLTRSRSLPTPKIGDLVMHDPRNTRVRGPRID